MHHQRIKLNLHKYKTAGVQQFSIDNTSDEDEFEDQSSISASDDDFSGSDSESYQDTTESTAPSEATTDEMIWGRRRAPVCGVAATVVRRQYLMKLPREPVVLAPPKKTYQSYEPRPRMGVSRSTKELYSQAQREQDNQFARRERSIPARKSRLASGSCDLSAIEEVSPIRTESYSHHSDESMPPTLRAQSEWKPQMTSSSSAFQPLSPLRKSSKVDDSHHFKAPMSPVFSSTPRSQRLYRKHQKQGRHVVFRQKSESIHDLRGEGSSSRQYLNRSSPDPWLDSNNENENPSSAPMSPVEVKAVRPETFGLDNAYAKHKDIRGIVFLSMSLCGRRLTLNIQNAYYFRSAAQPQTVCSYLSAVLCHRSRSSSSTKKPRPDEQYRTRLVPNTNSPTFDESFFFTFAENCYSDLLVVTIYEMDSANPERKKVLGCMTFPVSRLLKKANQIVGDQFFNQSGNMEDIEINNEGFFLLNKDQGRKQNFPQRKVRRQTYYEDPAFTGMSSAGSSVISANHGQMTAGSPRLSVPNELTMGDYYRSAEDLRVLSSANLDYTSASSSTNGSSTLPEQLKVHRATLPSITTTASENNSDEAKSEGSPEPTDPKLLFPDPENGGVYGAGPAHSALNTRTSVRRAASFTFSPKTSKRRSRDEGKSKFGPLTRTLSYLRNKMDLALSTSSLYPSREEVRQWENSFESILANKFGCALFRQFLKKEFSDENMDFWLECEEFKKMKDGKKSTALKGVEIYSEFVAEHSSREVNLDSDTRAATKAAVEGGCRPDSFALAQSRVEQLMAKDSYRRFLRDRLFLDLLESYDMDDKPSTSRDRN